MSHDKSEQKGQAAEETPRYVDPNSGAAPQPGGFAGPVEQPADSKSAAGADGAAPADAKSEPAAKSEDSEAKSESKGKARKS
jgi:hypothetical protein